MACTVIVYRTPDNYRRGSLNACTRYRNAKLACQMILEHRCVPVKPVTISRNCSNDVAHVVGYKSSAIVHDVNV